MSGAPDVATLNWGMNSIAWSAEQGAASGVKHTLEHQPRSNSAHEFGVRRQGCGKPGH